MDFWIILGAVSVVAVVLGYLVGHYHATTQWKALLAQIGPGVKADLSATEQEVIALFRKATGKAPAAPPAPVTAPPTLQPSP